MWLGRAVQFALLLGCQWTWRKQIHEMQWVLFSCTFLIMWKKETYDLRSHWWVTDAWNKPDPGLWPGAQPRLVRPQSKLRHLSKEYMLIIVYHYGVCVWLVCSNSQLIHLPLRDNCSYRFCPFDKKWDHKKNYICIFGLLFLLNIFP